MRTTKDRIRHTLGFEAIGLILAIPLAAWVFRIEAQQAMAVAIAASLLATFWNFAYNYGVDKLMVRYLGRLQKTLPERVVHAIGFELGLLVMILPFAAWWLSITLWEALIIDIGFVVFYVIYAFFYNLAYDKIFPVSFTPPAVVNADIERGT